jgi:hypothetical protein
VSGAGAWYALSRKSVGIIPQEQTRTKEKLQPDILWPSTGTNELIFSG